ncbi:MAG: AAA family ATPase [Allobaculum sp.]|nr:AAA family ATPase [Allobaculum sp.]
MKKQVIYVYGASGSGTSTFGRYLAKQLHYFFMDIDDYFWQPTSPPYQIKRSPSARIERLKTDIVEHDHVVLSGSLMDWGDELIPLFTLAIRLETATPIRIERLKKRERARFGHRLDVGGDMYETHQKFLAWAALYDEGGLNMRSRAKFEHWERQLGCPQLLLNGNLPLETNFERIKPFLLQEDQEKGK